MQNKLSLNKFIDRLEAHGYTVTKSVGVYRPQCPAHNGDGLNLAVSEGKDGKVLTICHSRGCSHQEIMQALGLEKEKPLEMKTAIPIGSSATST